jgi:hypothetical protein
MPEIEKKESGRPAVEQPERGDPRLREQPIEKARDAGVAKGKSQDRPPGQRPGSTDSPWMGGG